MLQTAKTREQKKRVSRLVRQLIHVNPKTTVCEDTLLHLCTFILNRITSGYFVDPDPVVSEQ